MQLAQLAATQEAQHATLHQIIEGLNAVAFNVSDAGRSNSGGGQGYRGRPGPGRSTRRGYPHQIGASSYHGGYTPPGMARGAPISPPPIRAPGQFDGIAGVGGIPAYRPPTPGRGGPYTGTGYTGRLGYQGGRALVNMQAQPPYSNIIKRYANWNICYSCGFDVTTDIPACHAPLICAR